MVGIARVYDVPRRGWSRAVLVDRLWPRGLAKDDAPFGRWVRDAAPSTELGKWYAHVPDRFDEFARRYRRELARSPAKEAVAELRELDATVADAGHRDQGPRALGGCRAPRRPGRPLNAGCPDPSPS